MSQTSSLEDEVAPSCQQALDHLRDRRPEATLIAVHGDWAYVAVGDIDVAAVTDVFEEKEALGIVRIPTDFPAGTRPYGLITIPHLEREDGQPIDSQHRNHQKARPVDGALETDDIGFWSWRWEDIARDDPSDLQKAPEMIRKRLQMED